MGIALISIRAGDTWLGRVNLHPTWCPALMELILEVVSAQGTSRPNRWHELSWMMSVRCNTPLPIYGRPLEAGIGIPGQEGHWTGQCMMLACPSETS
jgi:hypothetical protein